MVLINTIEIDPPLLNSSCAWSSDLQQLLDLYNSPYTGAITTRTATWDGFKEDCTHKVVFHEGITTTTLNSYGYSPHPLSQYISWVEAILASDLPSKKPVIISITSSNPQTLLLMVQAIQGLRERLHDGKSGPSQIAIELNTSCPNIPDSPPSGYSFKSLTPLLQVLADAHASDHTLTIGLKLPPYVHKDQFADVYTVLQEFDILTSPDCKSGPISFLTCTNTLGNSLLFSEQTSLGGEGQFAVPTVLGGLAGESLHPLALGNVYSFRKLLSSSNDSHDRLRNIKIIGVGGVTNQAGAQRMKLAGADVVGCATLLGKEGVRAFEILGKA